MSRPSPSKLTVIAVAAAYGVAVAVVILRSGEPQLPRWWVAGLAFFLWGISPICAAVLIRASWISAAGLLVIAVTGFYLYSLGDALLFLFVPLYQWVAVGMLAVGAGVLRARVR